MKILKITALALSLMMILSLISCGKKKSEDTDTVLQDTETLVTDTETKADTDTVTAPADESTAALTDADTGAPADTAQAEEPDETTGASTTSAPASETSAAETTASAKTTDTVFTYSPDDELFSTPPVLGDVDGIWRVLSSDSDYFVEIKLSGKWYLFTFADGEFVTKASGTIVKGGDGYIYAEGDGKRQKIYWEDTNPCFERYGQLAYCSDEELENALDASIK